MAHAVTRSATFDTLIDAQQQERYTNAQVTRSASSQSVSIARKEESPARVSPRLAGLAYTFGFGGPLPPLEPLEPSVNSLPVAQAAIRSSDSALREQVDLHDQSPGKVSIKVYALAHGEAEKPIKRFVRHAEFHYSSDKLIN